jgi:hypothetical protein
MLRPVAHVYALQVQMVCGYKRNECECDVVRRVVVRTWEDVGRVLFWSLDAEASIGAQQDLGYDEKPADADEDRGQHRRGAHMYPGTIDVGGCSNTTGKYI